MALISFFKSLFIFLSFISSLAHSRWNSRLIFPISLQYYWVCSDVMSWITFESLFRFFWFRRLRSHLVQICIINYLVYFGSKHININSFLTNLNNSCDHIFANGALWYFEWLVASMTDSIVSTGFKYDRTQILIANNAITFISLFLTSNLIFIFQFYRLCFSQQILKPLFNKLLCKIK